MYIKHSNDNYKPVSLDSLREMVEGMAVASHAIAIYQAINNWQVKQGISSRIEAHTYSTWHRTADSDVRFQFEIARGSWERLYVELSERNKGFRDYVNVTVLDGCTTHRNERNPRRDCDKSAEPLLKRVREYLDHNAEAAQRLARESYDARLLTEELAETNAKFETKGDDEVIINRGWYSMKCQASGHDNKFWVSVEQPRAGSIDDIITLMQDIKTDGFEANIREFTGHNLDIEHRYLTTAEILEIVNNDGRHIIHVPA